MKRPWAASFPTGGPGWSSVKRGGGQGGPRVSPGRLGAARSTWDSSRLGLRRIWAGSVHLPTLTPAAAAGPDLQESVPHPHPGAAQGQTKLSRGRRRIPPELQRCGPLLLPQTKWVEGLRPRRAQPARSPEPNASRVPALLAWTAQWGRCRRFLLEAPLHAPPSAASYFGSRRRPVWTQCVRAVWRRGAGRAAGVAGAESAPARSPSSSGVPPSPPPAEGTPNLVPSPR